MAEENLRRILDALTETSVYVVREDDHRILYVNRHVRQISPEAAPGRRCHEVWKENCVDCPLERIGERASNHTIHYGSRFGQIVDMTADRMLWDGTVPAFLITVMPHKLDFREGQDLERIRKMYAQSLVTVFGECIIANLTENYYVNCQMDEMWGRLPPSGRFDTENEKYAVYLLHPADTEAFRDSFSRKALLRQFGAGRRSISRRLRRRMEDGTFHMVEYTAVRIDPMEDEACWCVLVFRDIQEEFLQEQKMNLEISQLATAAHVAYQMLISVNLTQNSYYMMEYDRFHTQKAEESGVFDDLIATGASTLAPEYREEFVRRFSRTSLLTAFAHGVKEVSMELRQMGDDGRYHWNITQVVRVNSPLTDDVLEITMVKNIDEERRQQEETMERERRNKELLMEALKKEEEANRAKSEFLSRMSHDIRTPMNAIVGMSALAQTHLDDRERLQDELRNIQASSAHLLGLISEVLDMSRIESGRVEVAETELDLRELAENVVLLVEPLVREKRQRLESILPEQFHSVVAGDAQKLRQVLTNLLENASKYTAPGGSIRMGLEELEPANEPVGTYRFLIEDTGIGMKPEYLEHIFEPFSRADDSRISRIAGTGLGMTIVQNLVHMMGGTIRVESEYGKGTRFSVEICFEKRNTALPAEEADAPEQPEQSGMRVLLVEDHTLNQRIATEMLQYLGACVEVAENGCEAVARVSEKPPFYYDLVFMDVRMPVMDGCEAARRIRSSGKPKIEELPIVAMTADAFPEDVKRTRLAGMNGHLTKPIEMEQLRRVLTRCRAWKRSNHPEGVFVI